jgi:hypothetical protein
METIANYLIKNKRKIGHWSALLEEWILSIERFCRITDGDAPYWYNERANIGILAAAAWRCGRIALEEFQHHKIDASLDDEQLDQEQNTRYGRCDLWISDDRKAEIIEAKFRWLNMLSNKMDELAGSCLKAAVLDAKSTVKVRPDIIRGIGVAFLPTYAKSEKVGDENDLEKVIFNSISSVCKNTDSDIVAWCFPKLLRKHVGEKYNNYLPGTILIAKTVEPQ